MDFCKRGLARTVPNAHGRSDYLVSRRTQLLLEIILAIPTLRTSTRDEILKTAPSFIIIEMIKILQKQDAIKWSDINGSIGSRYDPTGNTVHINVKRWAEENDFTPKKRAKIIKE